MSQLQNPVIYVNDPTKSRAIFNGKLFFGVVDTDPTIAANQKLVRKVEENGSLTNLTQPVATNSGGSPTLDGTTPIVLDVDGDYSYQANDRFDAKIVFVSRVENPEDGSQGFSGVVVSETITLTLAQTTLVFTTIDANASVYYLQSQINDQGFLKETVDYTITNSTTIELTSSYNVGDKVEARQNDPKGELVEVNPDAQNLLVFVDVPDAQTAATNGNLENGDVCTLNGNAAVGDGLGGDKYNVITTAFGNDGVNFIDLNGTLQLELISGYYRFQNYSETIDTPNVSATVLTLDLNTGTVQDFEITENISDVVFVNFNPDSAFASTVTLRVTQDVTGSWSIAWPASITWAGGSAPTLTAAAGSVDFFGFTTFDGGTNWIGATYGQDIK